MLIYLAILFLLIASFEGVPFAPYQAGIFLFDSYNPNFGAKNFPICSAAIIHPLFCLTTAACLHKHTTSSNNAKPHQPSSIYIKSGNFSENRENIKYARTIHIHPEFGYRTMKNDIALLQVEPTYQFDEQWIQLSDAYTRYTDCFYSINTPNVTSPFSQAKRISVINNDLCYRNDINAIRNGVCSYYNFDHSFMCQVPETQLKFSRDRGTPLLCDNPPKLVGILSVIIPANMTNSTNFCTRTLQTYAIYSKVSLYEKWIYSVIATNTPSYTANGKPFPLVPLTPPFQSSIESSSNMNLGTISTAGQTNIWKNKNNASVLSSFSVLTFFAFFSSQV